MEQLTDITGSQTEAAMLVNQMKAYDIPATDDKIKAGTDAIDRAKSLTNISNETKAYLVRNNMNPTVTMYTRLRTAAVRYKITGRKPK